MNDTQHLYVNDENSIDGLPLSPAQTKKLRPNLMDNQRTAEGRDVNQGVRQRFYKSVSRLFLKTHRQKIMVFGGISAALLIVCSTGWRIIAPYFSASRPADVFQPTWLDHQTIQREQQSELSTLEPNASPQLAEDTDPIARHQPEVESLINELAQINARLDGLEKKVDEFKTIAKPLITNVLHKKSLAERPIARPPQVRQTHSIAYMHQLQRTRRAVPSHNMATAKRDKQVSQKVQSAAQSTLHLRAVLEGRAWLQTQDGVSITVSTGEMVPGAGIVKVIDAEQGQIIFSDGLVLR